MPYLPTAQSWLEQSTLLVAARPTTTRITTKYTIPSRTPKTPKPSSKTPIPSSKPTDSPPADPSNPPPPKPPPNPTPLPTATALLTLKTYDPVSGATLKYATSKAAEVSRLIASLGRLAGVSERDGDGDVKMADEEVKMADGGEESVVAVEKGGKVVEEKEKEKEKEKVGGGKGKKRKGKK